MPTVVSLEAADTQFAAYIEVWTGLVINLPSDMCYSIPSYEHGAGNWVGWGRVYIQSVRLVVWGFEVNPLHGSYLVMNIAIDITGDVLDFEVLGHQSWTGDSVYDPHTCYVYIHTFLKNAKDRWYIDPVLGHKNKWKYFWR